MINKGVVNIILVFFVFFCEGRVLDKFLLIFEVLLLEYWWK